MHRHTTAHGLTSVFGFAHAETNANKGGESAQIFIFKNGLPVLIVAQKEWHNS